MSSPGSYISELTSLLGPSCVSVEEPVLAVHSTDKWFASARPDVVVFAESSEQVSALFKFASERRIPVTPRGAGVGYVGGCVPLQAGIALSLAKMNRILEINEADGVAVVQPGVITGDLQKAVKERGWFYPPDPASLKECSLGGNISTNAGGPRCLKYGVTRPYVLGLEAVIPDGTILRAGGRCHKNKTGFDLVGLFTGSEGLLGVVTEATLRLIPHPPLRAMLSVALPPLQKRPPRCSGSWAADICRPPWRSPTASRSGPPVTMWVNPCQRGRPTCWWRWMARKTRCRWSCRPSRAC